MVDLFPEQSGKPKKVCYLNSICHHFRNTMHVHSTSQQKAAILIISVIHILTQNNAQIWA